ncbi:MAG: DUF4272 domain-containing protein [Fimbriimonadaceae bacterium]|nr:DUF4272 domain-containing protein [Fimbriimonadaceae bacterium]
MVDVTTLKPSWLWVLGEEGERPSQERQLKRMLCLTSMTILSASAEAIQDDDPSADEALALFVDARDWIVANAGDELTKSERLCVETPPDQWSEQQLIDGSWCFQAAGAIGWALGLTQWLPIWESYGPEHFEFNFLASNVEDVAQLVKPLPPAEVDLKNSVACAWLWRCRHALSERDGFWAKLRRSRKSILAEFTDELFKSGEFDAPIEGDYNVLGRPFRSAPVGVRGRIQSSATERLRALNWLHGQDPDYENISCDT